MHSITRTTRRPEKQKATSAAATSRPIRESRRMHRQDGDRGLHEGTLRRHRTTETAFGSPGRGPEPEQAIDEP